MTRRKKSQSFGFEANSKFSGNEFALKRSKRVGEDNFKFELSRENITIPNVFNLGSGIIATGGYVYSNTESTVNIKLSSGGNVDEKKVTIEKGLWEGVGHHLQCPVSKGDFKAEITVSKANDESYIDLYGFDINAVRHSLYIKNKKYDDGKSAGERFLNKPDQYVPSKYHLNHMKEVPIEPDNISLSKLPDGEIVVLKSCNREPDHMRPCGVGLQNEKKCDTFVAHKGNKKLEHASSHSTVDPYQVTEEELSERIIRPLKFKKNERYPGYLYDSWIFQNDFRLEGLQLDQGYQYECNTCKKFQVNNQGNFLRSKEQRWEDSIRRRTREKLLRELLDDAEPEKGYRKIVIDDFGGCFICGSSPEEAEIEIDHIMPLAYLWPINGNAMPLCQSCHQGKGKTFPKIFYQKEERTELIEDYETIKIGDEIHQKMANDDAIEELKRRIVWFFDDFLSRDKYQEETDQGVKVAEKFVDVLHQRFRDLNDETDLIDIYENRTGKTPDSVNPDSVEH